MPRQCTPQKHLSCAMNIVVGHASEMNMIERILSSKKPAKHRVQKVLPTVANSYLHSTRSAQYDVAYTTSGDLAVLK